MKRLFSIISGMVFRFPRLRLVVFMLMIFVLFSVLSVIVTQSDQVSTDPVGWESFRVYSPAGVECRSVNTDRNANTIAIVYEGASKGTSGIYVNASFDSGMSFMPAVKIAEVDSQVNSTPCVTISDNGEIRVAWYSVSGDDSGGSMFQAYSKDLGASWSQPERITFGLQMEILPVLKFDNRGGLHLFFTAYKGKFFNLLHAVAGQDGKFGQPEPVAELDGGMRGAFFPAIKFSGSRIAVAWQAKEKNYQDSIYFTGSDDYGKNWSSAERVTPQGSNYQAPSIEIVDRTVYLVFMNNKEKTWAIRMMKSPDFGENWEEEQTKISTTNVNCYSPDISPGPGNDLYIIWHDSREKQNTVYLRRYSLSDRKLSDETGLSVRKKPGRNASVVNTTRRVMVFWEEAGRIVSLFSDISADAPVVRSGTHSQDAWSKNTDAVIEWNRPRDESGIAGYATVVDKNPDTNPQIQTLKADADRFYINGLEDGITYFHIRTIDGADNMSRTVHYRLQVSSNPLSMPIVISTTHPEGGKSVNTDAVFRWAVNDTRRLKGFVYSLSEGIAVNPDKFIEQFEIKFTGLENGIYYFNIAAISMTNQVSKVATYGFIVGTEGEFDTEYMKKLADQDFGKKEKKVEAAVPSVEINLPFAADGVYNRPEFDAFITTRNIQKERISGYSVVIGDTRREPAGRINYKNNLLPVRGLVNGSYVIGVKCKYWKYSGGRKVQVWTDAVYAGFTINLEQKVSPLEKLYASLMKRFAEHPVIVSVIMALCTAAVAFVGFGDRIVFYFRLANFRIRYYF